MQIIFLGVHYQINNLEITDLIRFAHANPASLRTQENNFGSKICQKYFKIILQTSGHRKVMFMGGEFTGTYMYVKPQEKKCPMIIWGGMVLYMTLKGWEPGFKSVEMVL